MRTSQTLLVGVALLALLASTVSAAQIEGEYLEARSCPVYSGECFINAEIGLSGKEATMAWKVDKGSWNGVNLDGLGVALVTTAERTIGSNEVIPLEPGKTRSLILVDQRANKSQQAALVAFVKDSAKKLTKNVVSVERVPFKLENDHLSGKAAFRAGKLAAIETRAIREGDCVCRNEIVFFDPLNEVENQSPAYSTNHAYRGAALGRKWTNTNGPCNAFLATFRR